MSGLHLFSATLMHVFAIAGVSTGICPLHVKGALGYRPARYERGRVEPFWRVGR